MAPTCVPLHRLQRDERGMALALAIFALVIIATLISGVFFMARLEQRSGSNALWATQAAEAADAGLNATLANWSGSYNGLAVGASSALATQTLGSSARYTVTIQKVTPQIFLVQSRGERTGGGGVLAGTTVGRIVRMVVPNVNIKSAVTANGPVTLAGSIIVDGRDTDPPFWPACTTKDTVAAVRTSSSITEKGGGKTGPLTYGDPPPKGQIEGDATVTAADFTGPYSAFTAIANKVSVGAWSASNSPYPSSSGGVCDQSNFRNWGEPFRDASQGGYIPECAGYSPVIWIQNSGAGDAMITGGRGQGILVVDGNVEMAGGFEFNGIILVMGDFRTTGTGAKITGALLAANQTVGDATYVGGNPVVTYSSCAISTALAQSASVRPIAERSWVQLY